MNNELRLEGKPIPLKSEIDIRHSEFLLERKRNIKNAG
jgi:hypothetical protein